MALSNLIYQLKGGSGSGNFGHSGRPGHKGGSVGGAGMGGGSNNITPEKLGSRKPVLIALTDPDTGKSFSINTKTPMLLDIKNIKDVFNTATVTAYNKKHNLSDSHNDADIDSFVSELQTKLNADSIHTSFDNLVHNFERYAGD